jgi:hypothetical protein
LHKPFDDFRDYFVGFYQKNVERQKSKKFKFSAVLAVFSVMLFLASCGNRRLMGDVCGYEKSEDEKEIIHSTSTQINDDGIFIVE